MYSVGEGLDPPKNDTVLQLGRVKTLPYNGRIKIRNCSIKRNLILNSQFSILNSQFLILNSPFSILNYTLRSIYKSGIL